MRVQRAGSHAYKAAVDRFDTSRLDQDELCDTGTRVADTL